MITLVIKVKEILEEEEEENQIICDLNIEVNNYNSTCNERIVGALLTSHIDEFTDRIQNTTIDTHYKKEVYDD